MTKGGPYTPELEVQANPVCYRGACLPDGMGPTGATLRRVLLILSG